MFLILMIQVLLAENWHPIMKATSLEELMETDRRIQKLSQMKGLCARQLAKGEFPSHCLRLLNDEPQSSLALSRRWLKQVNQKCVQNCEDFDDFEILSALTQQALPKACRQHILERLDDLAYIKKSGMGFD